MFDEADKEIVAWIGALLPDSEVVLGRPSEGGDKLVVGAYLFDVTTESGGTDQTRVLRVGLRYLVTTSASNPMEAHRRLGDLMFAAMEHPKWKVERGELAPGFWAALDLPPRPCFRLQVPVVRARAVTKAPVVRAPLQVRQWAMHPVHGVVLGPGEIGIADARIEWVDLNLWTRTDSRGRFRFPSAPPLESARLRVLVKGKSTVIGVNELKRSGQQVEIRMTNLEG